MAELHVKQQNKQTEKKHINKIYIYIVYKCILSSKIELC